MIPQAVKKQYVELPERPQTWFSVNKSNGDNIIKVNPIFRKDVEPNVL